jgi:hypothetical protein
MSGFLVALQALRNQTPHHREPCVTVEERPWQGRVKATVLGTASAVPHAEKRQIFDRCTLSPLRENNRLILPAPPQSPAMSNRGTIPINI